MFYLALAIALAALLLAAYLELLSRRMRDNTRALERIAGILAVQNGLLEKNNLEAQVTTAALSEIAAEINAAAAPVIIPGPARQN